jgi:uncharacterized protein (DUF58 family)
MRPSKFALQLLAGWLGFAGLLVLLRLFEPEYSKLFDGLWLTIGLMLLLAMLNDAWHALRLKKAQAPFSFSRDIASSLSLNKYQQVYLTIKNLSGRKQNIAIKENLPPCFVLKEAMPFKLQVEAKGIAKLRYHCKVTERGEFYFGDVAIRYRSSWNLWDVKCHIKSTQQIKVYPDFMTIAQLDALHDQFQIQQLGVHQLQRRGEGTDFHQLRDYRPGDALKNIDWKATAKRHKLITKDYQDERDQEIIFLIDCGRNMRSKDGELSLFDHSLNALLLSSYIALRCGDSVSVKAFAGQQRSLQRIKGQNNINQVLNGLYDLNSTLYSADYVTLAKKIASEQRKRSLIILISNVNKEARTDLVTAVKLLSARHLVMVGSIQETAMQKVLEKDIDDMDDALQYCTMVDHSMKRTALHQQLKQQGVIIVDSKASLLHVGLLNEYSALKRSGRF